MAKRVLNPSTLALADDLEQAVHRHIVNTWFPRAVDPAGGFYEGFAFDWSRLPGSRRSTVYQSRMIWLAAALARAQISSEIDFGEVSMEGVRFMAGKLIDPESGAVEWGVDGSDHFGPPHHLYAASFAIFALSAVRSATGCPKALEFAKRIFWRTDDYLRDHQYGGYFSVAQNMVEERNRHRKDVIGCPNHYKSQNSLLHLMEAYTELVRIWPGSEVKKRLGELISIFKTRLLAPEGRLYEMTEANWTPASNVLTFGHDIEASHLLIEPEQNLNGSVGEDTWQVAQKLLDHTLDHGWDENEHAFWTSSADRSKKVWWVQAEGLLGLINGLRIPGGRHDLYERRLHELWGTIRDRFFDPVHGGLYDALRPGEHAPKTNKAYAWKAGYHDGRAFLYGSRLLRSLSDLDS